MDSKLESVLQSFRMVKYPVSKIEKDLGFSNGLLGKVAKGQSNLSQEKAEKLIEYYDSYTRGNDITIPIPSVNVAIKTTLEVGDPNQNPEEVKVAYGRQLAAMEESHKAYIRKNLDEEFDKEDKALKTTIEQLTQIEGVTTADKVPVPEKKEPFTGITPWIADIEAYCDKNGIIPQDLIECHQNSLKSPKKASNKELLGRGEEKPASSRYDLFKIKMGIKD